MSEIRPANSVRWSRSAQAWVPATAPQQEQEHIPIPNAIPLDDLIDKICEDPEFLAEMDKARPVMQEHMMAAPTRQHVSDAVDIAMDYGLSLIHI